MYSDLEHFDRILGVPGLPSTVMNPDCGYGSFIVGGSDLVGPALAGGVQAACNTGFSGDADVNGTPDVVDGCYELCQPNADGGCDGYPGDFSATTAFVGACIQLGFSEDDCNDLAVLAQGAVTSTFVCYDVVSHTVDPTITSEDDCTGATQIWTATPWDCYGLLGLTYQSEGLCSLAAGVWLEDCVLGDGLSSTFNVLDAELAPWGGF
jgi:hypothetical protein